MRITELLNAGRKIFSFEFYPPKTEEDARRLFDSARELKALNPDFVSVTNSSSGATPYRTVALSGVLKAELGLETVAHLTCVAHTRAEINDICLRLKAMGIKNILALRGDIHNHEGAPVKREYNYAAQLVADLKKSGDFSIGGACYPEKHPEAETLDADIDRLKEKVDAGAEYLITQLFFANDFYFRFLDKTAAAGINIPILPGLMPLTGYKQLENLTKLMKVSVPDVVRAGLERWAGDKENLFKFSVDYASVQARELLEKGAPGLHLYTLNRSRAAIDILKNVKARV
ncbi:MAG: methylenetetrahydrofolate reductase [NAD(P)H] [Elusimicrobia bacterium RIFOXYA2_FULL_58_8]|nr:MAG: methylenetetrahydrofolate reductase [NAD(P)H] [Elusimicrobia bacterium RIFOXYA12_FULL_57_11]OGS13814.1 MAG: methylenetetrahydrofolate reductase [NAD(P)H] [Elusimicrobia bacterium RIFOXYA2_FULL_58_8]